MRQTLFRLAAILVALCTVLAVAGPAEAAPSRDARSAAPSARTDVPPGGARTAAAAAVYPSGCHTEAYGRENPAIGAGTDWMPNCWVGSGYITNAVFVAGIQVEDGDWGCNNGGKDGQFGPNTEAGVKCFQRNRGISADGIVGSDSWWNYGDVLYYTGAVSNYWQFTLSGDIYINRFVKGDYTDASGHFGPYALRCGETSLLFYDGPYPNPKVPCV